MNPSWDLCNRAEPTATVDIFLSAFDDVPDPRAENARHDLGELLVIAFIFHLMDRNHRLLAGPLQRICY